VPSSISIADNVTIPGSYYFDIQSSGVTIDGLDHTFTITSATDGLFRNGTNSQNGFNNVTIQNVSVNGSSATLNDQGGWVCQTYFGRGASSILVQYCNSIGDISGNNSGGILGSQAGSYGGNVSANKCYSTGNISGQYSGGIFGLSSGNESGNASATNCYSTGNISNFSGGIFGGYCASNRGTVSATNCYSTGSISTPGGIFGVYAGFDSGTAAATNCYFLYGTNVAGPNSTVSQSSYYYAPNYPSGTWSDTNASVILTGDPTTYPGSGTVWTSVGSETPFVLTGINLATPVISSASATSPTTASVVLSASVPDASSYTATSNPGGLTGTSVTTTITLTGLTSATSYTFTVVATNGTTASSLSSDPSNPVTTP
jgi:hypothetical protein